jgi:excisionase family DNA binding protein
MEAAMTGPPQNLTLRNPTQLNARENAFVDAVADRLLSVRAVPGIEESAASKQQLLNTREAAKVLNITEGTLHVWRCEGRYKIKFIKIGSKIRYRLSDLLDWLESRAETPKPERKRKPKRSGQ